MYLNLDFFMFNLDSFFNLNNVLRYLNLEKKFLITF